ncbi:MAG: hypothetical protein ACR2O4_02640 [Hyphomicrobiaceae bacterium]
MNMIDILADAQDGSCLENLGRHHQLTPSQVQDCARLVKPVISRQINDLLLTDDGTDIVLHALADPAVRLVQTDPRTFSDPAVRQTGEALLRQLARNDIDPWGMIDNIARSAQVSRQALHAMMPHLSLLFVGAIRQQLAPVFRKVLIRYQPDDAATDPFVFVRENVARLRTSTPSPAIGWLDTILSRTTSDRDAEPENTTDTTYR